MSGEIEISRKDLDLVLTYGCGNDASDAAWDRLRAALDAPVVERQKPVASDIAHDRAYRNGMMAGFSFGIRGDEDGYAKAVERYDAEIHAAKAEQPAPVAAPDGWKLVPIEPTDDMIVAFAEAWYSRRQTIDDPDMLDAYRDMLDAAPACLDKVKELNQ